MQVNVWKTRVVRINNENMPIVGKEEKIQIEKYRCLECLPAKNRRSELVIKKRIAMVKHALNKIVNCNSMNM